MYMVYFKTGVLICLSTLLGRMRNQVLHWSGYFVLHNREVLLWNILKIMRWAENFRENEKELNRYFLGDNTQVANEHRREWVLNLTVLGNSKQNHGGLPYTLTSTATKRMTDNTRCWWEYSVWEHELMHPLWKIVQHCLLMWRMSMVHSPATPCASGDTCKSVHSIVAMTVIWNWLRCYSTAEWISGFVFMQWNVIYQWR